MKDTIVIRFLKILSERELTGLRFFVQNPYFSSNNDVARLFGYLEQFAPNFKDVNLTAENAFKEIYPNKKFDRRALNSLMNKLYDVIKRFIKASESRTNRVDVEISTLKFCKKRCPEKFENQLRRVRRLINAQEKGGMLYHYKLIAEYELMEYLALKLKPVNYIASSEMLDKFYWFLKLPLFAETLNYKLINAEKGHDFSALETYLKLVRQAGYAEIPLIQLWYCIVNIFKNIIDGTSVTLEDYRKYKTLLFQNSDDLDDNDRRNLYIYLRNVIRFSSFEDDYYYREEFEIDQLVLEQGLIFLNGYLRELTIKNIINSAIRLGEIQWTKDFLCQYKDAFMREYADDIHAYCEAVINFYEGKYKEALALFTEVEYNHVLFEIEKRIKLMQIYYETEKVELFYNEIGKLRSYISNNKNNIGDMYRQSYLDFATYARRISDTIRRDLDEITKLETEIREIPVRLLFEKKWLLDKLGELKQ